MKSTPRHASCAHTHTLFTLIDLSFFILQRSLCFLFLSYLINLRNRHTLLIPLISFCLNKTLLWQKETNRKKLEILKSVFGFNRVCKWNYRQMFQAHNKLRTRIFMCQQQMIVSLRGSSWRGSSKNLHAKVICQIP